MMTNVYDQKDIPVGTTYAFLRTTTYHTQESHGYPSTTEQAWILTVCENKAEWEEEIKRRQNAQRTSYYSYVPVVLNRPKINVEIEVSIEQ